jgi:uncharacterized membrane protein YheB (UPF0754 family)
LNRWAAKGISDVIVCHGINVEEGIDFLVDHLFSYLEQPDTPHRIQAVIGRLLEDQRGRTIRLVLADLFGVTENEIVDFVSSKLLAYLSDPQTPDTLSTQIVTLAGGYLEDRGTISVGELLRIDSEKKEKLDLYLATHFSRLLRERLPYLVETFNIRQLVVEKINDLDVAQVEALLLMVIAKHLKWINIFGAFLGALIGFSQVLLRILGIV